MPPLQRMGFEVNAKTELSSSLSALAEVALIDAPACAAVGAMSVSWWHDEVRAGRAPKPVIQQPRCTRWRLADVRTYWAKRAEQSAANVQGAANMKARATKASAAAKAKRADSVMA